jgi:NADH-quinone oxidoreductase subunit N
MASGFLLYGLSMMYGATGSLDIGEVFKAVAHRPDQAPGAGVRPGVSCRGLAFKLGVVPFHMWVPDVYQGAPTAVTLLIGGAPKLAAFAIVIRLLVEGMLPLAIDWQQMLGVLAVARCWWATWPPLRRPTSSACWRTPPFRRWALCCWA